jgi:hypothetical protein
MPCQKCIANPGYHSFINFGSLGSTKLFYTAPAKTEDTNKDGTKLANITLHLKEETERSPWIWVLDCANMGLHQYTELSFNLGLLDVLVENRTLEEVWILHPNTWVRGVYSFFQMISCAPILKKTQFIEGSGLELLNRLEPKGLDMTTIHWLLKQ